MARVLVVDDDAVFRRTVRRALFELGHEVVEAECGEDAMAHLERIDLVITDLHMPRGDGFSVVRGVREKLPTVPVVMLTGNGTTADCVTAMRAGAHDFLIKPFHHDALARVVSSALGAGHYRPSIALLGSSATMRDVFDRVEQLAGDDCPVLLTGESDTGVEALARLVHGLSRRGGEPFVIANDRDAYRLAEGGCLFVPDVSALGREDRVVLERVLAEGAIRVLASTSRDLRAMAAAGEIEDSLVVRLAEATLAIPPLRERPEDVPGLVAHLLDEANRRHGRAFCLGDAALASLQAYGWPGNFGELAHVIDGLVGNDGEPISTRLATREESVLLTMFDGTRCEGALVLAEGDSVESAFADDRGFVEVAAGGSRRHYSKQAIAVVSHSASQASGEEKTRRVRIRLRHGLDLEGEVRDSFWRLLHRPGRVVVRDHARLHHVDKEQIVSVEETA